MLSWQWSLPKGSERRIDGLHDVNKCTGRKKKKAEDVGKRRGWGRK